MSSLHVSVQSMPPWLGKLWHTPDAQSAFPVHASPNAAPPPPVEAVDPAPVVAPVVAAVLDPVVALAVVLEPVPIPVPIPVPLPGPAAVVEAPPPDPPEPESSPHPAKATDTTRNVHAAVRDMVTSCAHPRRTGVAAA